MKLSLFKAFNVMHAKDWVFCSREKLTAINIWVKKEDVGKKIDL